MALDKLFGISRGWPSGGGQIAIPAPVFSVLPSISPSSGTATVTTFTASDGSASNALAYTRRWLLDGTPIGTGTTITPATTGNLVLEVTAVGAGGNTIAFSGGVTVSAIPAPVFSVQPSISPTSGVTGTTFTASDGTASNTTGYTRRWLLSGTAIGTGTTVVPGSAGSLVLEVTATGPGGSTIVNSSAVTVTATPTPTPSARIDPTITPQASPTTYPPAPAYTFSVLTQVGDTARICVAPTYTDAVNGTNLSINDASTTLTGTYSTDKAALNGKLAGISTGASYIYVQIERSGSVISKSNIIQHGTAAVPTVTAGLNGSVNSTFALSNTITLSGPIAAIQEIGDDMKFLEILNANVPAPSYTERWLGNTTEDYTNPLDFNLDNVYSRGFIITGLNGQQATTSIGGITVLQYNTSPTSIFFTPTTNAARSTPVTALSNVFAGMATGYAAPFTLSGNWTSFRIYDGTTYTGPFTSTSGKTVQNGYQIEVTQTTSASYLTSTTATLTIGTTSGNYVATTQADPTAINPTFNNWTVNNIAFGSNTSSHTLPLKAGFNVVAVVNNAKRTLAASVPGATSVLKAQTSGGSVASVSSDLLTFWEVIMPSDNPTATFTLTGSAAFQDVAAMSINMTNGLAGPTEVDSTPEGFTADPQLIGNGTTYTAGGLILALAGSPAGGSPITWNNATLGKAGTSANYKFSLGYMTASGTPSWNDGGFSGEVGLAANWSHS